MKLIREFLFLSRRELRGILLLVALIGAIVPAAVGYRRLHVSRPNSELQRKAEQEYRIFLSSITEKPYVTGGDKAYEAVRNDKQEPVLLPFNPNHADSVSLRRLGLSARITRNLLRYRAKGGKFRSAADFKKLYGMSDEQYRTLAPYIYIAPEDTARPVIRQVPVSQFTEYPKVEKYSTGTQIDLNLADTTELKKIPGIGSGYARRIVSYRKRLGGYYRIEQLAEIELPVDSLRSWFTLTTGNIRCLNLNKANAEQLMHHPYINFYQAKAIVEYRKKRGKLRSLKPFVLYEEFTEEELKRLENYVCY
jgi:DNA uptake protein ComE-like DNA-binding protein